MSMSTLFVMFLLQNSALWTSLILIPLSLMIILTNMNLESAYSLIVLLYSMVFIGGLMVLLVSISSLLSHENTLKFKTALSTIVLIIFIYNTRTHMKEHSKSSLLWASGQGHLMAFIIVVLLIALMVLSWQCIHNKGLSRYL